jgi:hypothetical protein
LCFEAQKLRQREASGAKEAGVQKAAAVQQRPAELGTADPGVSLGIHPFSFTAGGFVGG